MRLLVFGLTLLAVILFSTQFFKSKGTKDHIVRGYFVGILTVLVVIINTLEISLTKGLTWDTGFIVHTTIGSLFFLSLGATFVTGHMAKRNKIDPKIHGICVYITAIYLLMTLGAILLIKFLR